MERSGVITSPSTSQMSTVESEENTCSMKSSIRSQFALGSYRTGIRMLESTRGECGSSCPVQIFGSPFSRLIRLSEGLGSSSGASEHNVFDQLAGQATAAVGA